MKWIIACLFITCLDINAQSSWTELNGPPLVRDIRSVAVTDDMTSLYAVDKSMLFKSTDGGSTWIPTATEILSPLVVGCAPSNGNSVVVGDTGLLRKSTNGGSVWNTVITDYYFLPYQIAISPSPSYVMYIGAKYLNNTVPFLYSTNGGGGWYRPTPGNFPWHTNVTGVRIDPSASTTVWIGGSDGTTEGIDPNKQNNISSATRGVWKSTDNGQTWSGRYMGDFNVSSLTVRSLSVWAATGSGKVFKSSNEGDTWVQVGSPTGATTIRQIFFASDSYLYCSTDNGVQRSTDDGTTWSGPIGSGMVDRNVNVCVNPAGNVMFSGGPTALYISTDMGSTWTNSDNGLGRMPVSWSAVNGISKSWSVGKDYETIRIRNGSDWTTTTISGFRGYHVLRNPDNPPNGYIFVSGSNNQHAAMYRSMDGGVTFSPVNVATGQAADYIYRGSVSGPTISSRIYVFGKDGTSANFYKIPNYGADPKESYTISGSATNCVNSVAIVSDNGSFYYGLDNVGVYKSSSGPSNGNQVLSGITIKSIIARNNGTSDIVYAGGPTGLRKSTDGGATWNIKNTAGVAQVLFSPGLSGTDNVIMLRSDGTKILWTSDGGNTWQEKQWPVLTPIFSLGTESGPPSVLTASTEYGIYQITSPADAPSLIAPNDGGNGYPATTLSWNSVMGATSYHIQVATDVAFTNKVYDVPFVGSAWYSPVGLTVGTQYYWRVAANNFVGESQYSTARTFTVVTEGTITLSANGQLGGDGYYHPHLSWVPSLPVSTYHIYRASYIYDSQEHCNTCTYTYLASTTATAFDDLGVIWQPKLPVSVFCYQVYGSTISNWVHVNSGTGIITKPGEESRDRESIPTVTQMKSCYPNPFNPITTIQYDLSEPGLVQLKVYSVLGEEVATLVDTYQSAGHLSVAFNGSALASGLYFCRMETMKYHGITKLILVK